MGGIEGFEVVLGIRESFLRFGNSVGSFEGFKVVFWEKKAFWDFCVGSFEGF